LRSLRMAGRFAAIAMRKYPITAAQTPGNPFLLLWALFLS
jgi:hypothetical protein